MEESRARELGKKLQDLQVTVFGLGISGLAATSLLAALSCRSLRIVSQGAVSTWKNLPDLLKIISLDQCISQEEARAGEVLASSDLIVISPGIPASLPVLSAALKKGVPLWSEIELGFCFADVPVVAVTGSNGKTTTVSLIADMLARTGLRAFVGGNIGTPFCQYALEKLTGSGPHRGDYDLIVLEISSFQLETTHAFHPHVAIITNIFANHEERYQDVQSYADAKFKILERMNGDDFVIYPKDLSLVHEGVLAAAAGKGEHAFQVLPFTKEILLKELSSRYNLRGFRLAGWHNWENLYCAQKVLELLHQDFQVVQETINEFKGVPHRIERVETARRYQVVNDAKSTNLAATNTAIKALIGDGKDIYLIFGGKRRGEEGAQPGDDAYREVLGRVKKIFLIGETTDELRQRFEVDLGLAVSACQTLEKVVQEVDRDSTFTGILLLSPGHPSFDQFNSYAHRGEHFKSLFMASAKN